jgi:hypothetical protein
MFDFTDKAFDQVPFSIKMPVKLPLITIPVARRDNSFRARMFDCFNKRLRIIAFTGNQI